MIMEEAASLSPTRMSEDIRQLAGLYERVHPLPMDTFPVESPVPSLERLVDDLRSPLPTLDFYRRLAPIVNGTGDEHTHLLLPAGELAAYAERGGTFFPLDVTIVGGRAYLSAPLDGREPAPPLGAELLAIDGRPAAEAIRVLRGFFSGTGDRQRDFFVSTSFPEAYYLGFGPADSYAIAFRRRGEAATETATLPGARIAGERHETAFPVLNESPLRFRTDNGYRRLGDRTMALEFRAFENPRGRFDALLDEMFEAARIERRDALIVDLRRNIGGNSFVARSLLSRLAADEYVLLESSDLRASEELKRHFLSFMPAPLRALGVQRFHPWTRGLWAARAGESVSIAFKPVRPRAGGRGRFGGAVFFLAGPGDYSSSAILLGAVKRYGLATIVGEPSGGFPTHYGNCTRHALNHSGLEALIPAAVNHGLGTGPVIPDHEAFDTPDDIAEQRDAAMSRALELIALGIESGVPGAMR